MVEAHRSGSDAARLIVRRERHRRDVVSDRQCGSEVHGVERRDGCRKRIGGAIENGGLEADQLQPIEELEQSRTTGRDGGVVQATGQSSSINRSQALDTDELAGHRPLEALPGVELV